MCAWNPKKQDCGFGGVPHVPRETRGACNSLRVTMFFRLKIAGSEVCHTCPVTRVAREFVARDHLLSLQDCGYGGVPHMPRETRGA